MSDNIANTLNTLNFLNKPRDQMTEEELAQFEQIIQAVHATTEQQNEAKIKELKAKAEPLLAELEKTKASRKSLEDHSDVKE